MSTASHTTEQKAAVIVQKRGDWPWPQITEARHQAAPGMKWVEVTEDDAEYSLNVLPPIILPGAKFWGGAFMVGEAASALPSGEPTYTAFVNMAGRWFACDLAKSEYHAAFFALARAVDEEVEAQA